MAINEGIKAMNFWRGKSNFELRSIPCAGKIKKSIYHVEASRRRVQKNKVEYQGTVK